MKARISRFAFASTIVLSLAAPLHADTYNWNGSTTGGLSGADNIWDTVTANWTGTGTTWPSVSTTNDDAVFGGTAGAVTLTTAVTANDITISPSSGSTYTIGADNTLGSITLDGTSPRITCSSGSFHNIGAVIHGAGGLIKAGSITLQLRGVNDYSGDTQVLAGTLLIGLGNNRLPTGTKLVLGDSNTNSSGVFQMNSRSQQVGGLETAGTGTGNRVINGSSTLTTFTVSNPDDHIFGGILGGTGTNHNNYNFTKSGAGRLTLTNTNTFTGTATVSGGVLELGHATDTLADATPVNVNGGTLDIGDNTDTIGALTVTSGTITGGTGVLSAPSCAGKAGLVEAVLAGTTDLSGTDTTWLTKDTAGTLELASANTFTGNVEVTAGRLTLSNSQALGSWNNTDRKGLICQGTGRSVWLKGGITLPDYIDIYASSSSADTTGINNESDVNEITGPINFSSGNPALNISSSDGTLTISGNITQTENGRTLYLGGVAESDNIISGNIGESDVSFILPLIKQGSGKWILSGTNTYKGATTVKGGTLVVAAGGVINNANVDTGTGTVAGGTLLIDGGTAKFRTTANTSTALLAGDSANSGDITVTNNGTLSISTGRLILGGSGATPSGTSVFTQDSGTTTVAGSLYTANYAPTELYISGGDFTGTGTPTISQRANTNFNISGTANVTFPTMNLGGQAGTYDVNINLDGGTLAVNKIANSANGNTAVNFNGGTLKARQDEVAFLTADTATIGDDGGTIDTQEFNVTIGQALTRLDGATTDSLTKLGIGTLTLTGTNTYGGDTNVNDGTLELASGGSQAFYPLADGTSNKITGTGIVTLDGALAIDLTNATTATSWLLVDVGNLDETYGTNFIVTGFTETAVDSGVWTLTVDTDLYTFTEASGLLTRGPAATDDYTTWANSFTPVVGAKTADDDDDGLSNFDEYAFGLDPQSGASVNPISEQLSKTTGLFKYTRRATPGTTGVTYSYESSTTLSGAWDPFTPDSVVSDFGSPIEEITVDIPNALLAEPKLFIRVKAVKP